MLENTEDILYPRKETDIMIHFIYLLLIIYDNIIYVDRNFQKFETVLAEICLGIDGMLIKNFKAIFVSFRLFLSFLIMRHTAMMIIFLLVQIVLFL